MSFSKNLINIDYKNPKLYLAGRPKTMGELKKLRSTLVINCLLSFLLATSLAANEPRSDNDTSRKAQTKFAASRTAHDYQSLGFNELLVLNNLRLLGKSAAQSMASETETLFTLGRSFIVNSDELSFQAFKEQLLRLKNINNTLWAFEAFGAGSLTAKVGEQLSSLNELLTDKTVAHFKRDFCPQQQSCMQNIQSLGYSLVQLRQTTAAVLKEFEHEGIVTSSILSLPATNQLPTLLSVASRRSSDEGFSSLLIPYLIGGSEFFPGETRLIDYIGAQDADLANNLREVLGSHNYTSSQLANLLQKAERTLRP